MGNLKYLILFSVVVNWTPVAHTEPEPVKLIHIEREYKEAAERYNVDPRLFKALLYVESNFNHKAVNAETLDFGIGQINIKTIEAYDIDFHRLRHDREYSIDRAAYILSTFKRYRKSKLPESKRWVCKYNVGTGRLVGKRLENCNKYLAKLKWAYEVNQLGEF